MLKRTPLQRKTPMARTEFSGVPGVVRMRLTLPSSTPLRMDDGKGRASVPVQRKKKCRICKEPCTPRRPMAPALCSAGCEHAFALQLVEKSRQKAERTDLIERRAKLKTRSDWMKEAQAAFNAWVRLRDADQPCISCGRHHDGQWHAGHYLSTGARPELRFHEDNCHKQCAPCNTHLSGNLVLYRAELIRRRGLEVVDWLEGPHQPSKPTVENLKWIRDHYRALARALRQAAKERA